MKNTNGLNVVLVHGGWVDGSGWEDVHNILTRDGHHVAVVQIPTLSLADDVVATRRVIDAQDGPVVLVGHSYGGAVITEAGNDPKVAGLVYIAAFAPDKGESVASLIKDPPPDAPIPPILPPLDGYLLLDSAKFHDSFAADVDTEKAAFMADSQVPWGVAALSGAIGVGAAYGVTRLFGLVPPIDGFELPHIYPATAVLAMGSLGAAGIIGGLYPARRASLLTPVEALRQE